MYILKRVDYIKKVRKRTAKNRKSKMLVNHGSELFADIETGEILITLKAAAIMAGVADREAAITLKNNSITPFDQICSIDGVDRKIKLFDEEALCLLLCKYNISLMTQICLRGSIRQYLQKLAKFAPTVVEKSEQKLNKLLQNKLIFSGVAV